MSRILKTVSLATALVAAIPASAATWTVDGAHSAAQFSVRHMMVTTVRGDFSKISGTFEYDGKDLASLKVDAAIDVASVDTRNAKRDEHLRSADFFDAAQHPSITFKSKKATAAGPGRFKLTGDLTIRGVTKEVVLDVEGPTPEIKDPWGNTKIGASATTKINRQDFGVSWNKTLDAGGVVVGDEVSITIDLQLVKKADAPK